MSNTNQISNRWFYKIYMIFGSLFLLLCGVILVACFMEFYVKFVIPAALAMMALLLVFFVRQIKKGVLAVFGQCSRSLDQAMAGQDLSPVSEETELALFQTKLSRFLSMKERAFRDAKMQKGQIESLLADISHQTKTPIANILLYSQLLAERESENKELVQKLVSQSEKLKFLIQMLLQMARLENGIIRCTPEKANVRELLIQVIGDFSDKAQAKNLDITLECETQIRAFFDIKWMREAVGNIVDNAVKYTPEGGRIKIRAVSYELFVRIEVLDTGLGIQEEEIPKIFGRFYRGGQVSSSEGLGIGLYLAREMVTAQRGYIRVDSQEGQGCGFSIFIPAEAQ